MPLPVEPPPRFVQQLLSAIEPLTSQNNRGATHHGGQNLFQEQAARGDIKNFFHLLSAAFRLLTINLIRCHLEYSVWTGDRQVHPKSTVFPNRGDIIKGDVLGTIFCDGKGMG
jgi:hypothetical protein